jgi:hypothetical protein
MIPYTQNKDLTIISKRKFTLFRKNVVSLHHIIFDTPPCKKLTFNQL